MTVTNHGPNCPLDTDASHTLVDQNEIRTHQALVVAFFVVAYIFNRPEFVVYQAVMFVGTVFAPPLNPYVALYRFVLRPLGIIHRDLRPDNWQAHRFAAAIGLTVSAVAAYLLQVAQLPVWGWGLVWLMIILGVLAFAGWCAGCFTYYMIQKLAGHGFFRHAPVSGEFPGTRPQKHI